MNLVILSQKANLYSTQRLLEAGLERGHNMRVLKHMVCKIAIETNHPQLYYYSEKVADIDGIIPRIGASVTMYGAAVIQQFEMMGVQTIVTADALLRARDKLRSLQLLSMSGLELPKSIYINYTKNVGQIINEIGGVPIVIKLLEGTQGLGVILAENHNAAESVIEAFHKMKARIIVQEFIEESMGTDIRAFVVGGKVVASMKRIAQKGEFRSNIHRGASAIPVELTAKENETAIKAAKIMGLDVAGVDMLQSNRGPLVLEVNASPGLEGIETTTGVDVAGKIIDFLANKCRF